MGKLLRTYTRVNWENTPSRETPINDENLNNMDSAINDLYEALEGYDSDKLEKNTIVEVQIDGTPIEPDEDRVVNIDLERIDPILVDPYDIIDVTFTGITSLPQTYSVEGITADHYVRWGQLSNPSAATTDINFVTGNNGLVTLSGTIVSGKSTDIEVEFRKKAHNPTPVLS